MIDFAPTVLEVAGIPEPSMVNEVLSPYGAATCSYTFDAPEARTPRAAMLREILEQPRHPLQGVERGDQAPHPLKLTGEVRRTFDEDVGALRRQQRLLAQAHDLSREMPTSCASCSACG